MIITIFQNHTFKLNHAQVNKLGFDEASRQIPGVKEYMVLSMGEASMKWKPDFFEYFVPAAAVSIDTDNESVEMDDNLERVFAASNGHPQCAGDEYVNFGLAHSLSVGDLVMVPGGEFYIVNGAGFSKVEVNR
ncbi:MAG: hypothetical protein GY820_38205 [Gammaproteobacteria bacterium]|nr:hypothetical protein [Gammaproteobacteria bacterium]